MKTLQQLRQQLRKQRLQLNRYAQRQAAHRVAIALQKLPEWHSAQKVGLYLHAFGEIETNRLIDLAFRQHKQVYLPQVCAMNGCLKWVRISRQQYLNRRFAWHRLGMQQAMQRGIHVQQLDLLCMPLVAADLTGNRLGMGGGFYDRTLAQAAHRPYRLGLAHDFQLLTQILPRQPWDQALDALAMPQGLKRFK